MSRKKHVYSPTSSQNTSRGKNVIYGSSQPAKQYKKYKSKNKQVKPKLSPADDIVQQPKTASYHAISNADNSISRNIGTPSHITYLSKKENDDRRHRSRCIYYDKDTKHCLAPKGSYSGIRCPGSSHCTQYFERLEPDKPKTKSKAKADITGIKKRPTTLPGRITYGKKVILQCLDDDEVYHITIGINPDLMPPLQKLCLNRKYGDTISYSGYRYKIVKPQKINKDHRDPRQ